MKYIGIISCLLLATVAFAQPGEEVGPLTGNPQLQAKIKMNAANAKSSDTFDSSFIYYSDTISLPVFDDFSSNKFQQYIEDYLAPGVTSILEYKLLDLGSQPLPAEYVGTQQVTFHRIYNVQTDSYIDTTLTPTDIQLGDQTNYPTSYNTISSYPPYYIYDTITSIGGVDLNPDTVFIVGPELTQDSARQFFMPINDPNKIWEDSYVYHNYSMANDPWSLGVATFDGLDETGFPYAINSSTTGYADYLTSKPIDMSVVSISDSMYFSFMYQAQGLADAPEIGDSLVLQFYASGLDLWQNVWGVNGVPLDVFRSGHILIDDPVYFTDAFQFRFVNYGGLSGSLDHFHVDYVNLRSVPGFGGSADSILRDVAFSYPLTSLLQDYTSVPWDHYKNLATPNDVMSDNVSVTMANSFPTDISANDGTLEVHHNGGSEGSGILISDILCDNVNDNYFALGIPYSEHNIQSFYTFDQSKPGDSQDFEVISTATGGAPNFAGNDTTIFTQSFENYYSYDDGSAESAYGPTGFQARLAIQYTPYEADSIIGLAMHFVPSVDDVSNNLFLLNVWEDKNGVPADTAIYEDNIFFPRTPSYNYGYNMFSYYFFNDTAKIPVNGTFYVGWRQLEAERLNIGLDRNILSNDHTFYSIDGGLSWVQSSIEGSVMIRPIFSTSLDGSLGIEETTFAGVQQKSLIYPNPTRDKITIDPAGNFTGAVLRNMQGQVVRVIDQTEFYMNELPSGIYFLEIQGERFIHKISKL